MNPDQNRSMHRGLSLYLDVLRLIAALEVFAYHLAGLPKTGLSKHVWNDFGHEAVTIFFVLSGFVIPYAARSRERDPRAFGVARLTRIYSVALPCLALTYFFDIIGHRFDPSLYQGLSPHGSAVFRLFVGAAMLNESWVSVQMLSNTPYWSISYEFWYYALFAALFYLRGTGRIVATMIAAITAGPNILLLFPIWLVGWLAFGERATARAPKWLLWLGFAQPVVVFAAYCEFDLQRVGGQWLESMLGHELWWEHLAWSRYLLTDILLGISVALNLAAAKNLGPALEKAIRAFAGPVRWGVARSFTLYLLHQPTILVVTATLSTRVIHPLRSIIIATISLAILLLVAQFTELKRYLLRPGFQWLIDRICGLWLATTRKFGPIYAHG
jgi:peptidoglycan/LPS O-acetylase OafA/YrhL